MATCPYCTPQPMAFNDLLHDESKRELFFKEARERLCADCGQDFFEVHLPSVYSQYQGRYRTERFVEEKAVRLSIPKGRFQDLRARFGVQGT